MKSTVHKWEPPFNTTVENQEIRISEGENFDRMHRPKEHVFKLIKCDGNKALVEFNHLFTLKGHLHPSNRQIWVGQLEDVNFTYLWGNDGITKSLRLKEITE